MRDSVRKRISHIPLRMLAGPALAVLASAALLLGATATQAAAQTMAPASASVAQAARPAVAPGQQDLGGMTLLEYCQAHGWPVAFQDGSSPTGWWCSVGGTGATPRVILDLNAACQWQFADIVRVGFTAFNVGGNCKTVATSANRISDLNSIGQYCQAIGYAKAVVTGSAVTSWYCANSGGTPLARIDLHAACRWVNQSNPARGAIVVSYFPSYNARFEITCVALVH